jgi:hypothetical protein
MEHVLGHFRRSGRKIDDLVEHGSERAVRDDAPAAHVAGSRLMLDAVIDRFRRESLARLTFVTRLSSAAPAWFLLLLRGWLRAAPGRIRRRRLRRVARVELHPSTEVAQLCGKPRDHFVVRRPQRRDLDLKITAPRALGSSHILMNRLLRPNPALLNDLRHTNAVGKGLNGYR